jgi:hypothetical protein
MHIVTFEDGKISQIRLSWDQGALLKQLDVIGKTGRNWPIRDSREQLTAITSCLRKAAATGAGAQSNKGQAQPNGDAKNTNRQSTSFIHRDPHASLVLFGSREEIEAAPSVVSPYAGSRPAQRSFTDILGDEPEAQPAAVVSPYAGAKRQQRTFEEILGDDGGDDGHADESSPPSPSTGRGRSSSTKVMAKGGSSKNFVPNRLFDGAGHKEGAAEDEDDDETPQPQRFYRPDPAKYSHFDFADGPDPDEAPQPAPPRENGKKHKAEANWSFDDFVTPDRPQPTKAYQMRDARHWDMVDEKVTQETPHYRPPPPGNPRSDANSHLDDPINTPTAHAPLSNITNRQRASTTQSIADDKSSTDATTSLTNDTSDDDDDMSRGISIAGDGMGGRKGTDRSWMTGGEDPEPPKERIIIAGDGMGGRKGVDNSWREDGDQNPHGINVGGNGMGGRKGTDQRWKRDEDDTDDNGAPKNTGKIAIAGDGMGSRRGNDRGWMTGAGDEDVPVVGKEKITTAGDGMGGRKGVDNSWREDGDQNPHGISIAGNGMGGLLGTDQRWKRGEEEELDGDVPKNNAKIVIAGDGMGGRKDADNSWRYGGADPNEEVPGPQGGRRANDQRWGRDAEEGTEKKKDSGKIAIAGDGMGGRKGTERNWLYGDDD